MVRHTAREPKRLAWTGECESETLHERRSSLNVRQRAIVHGGDSRSSLYRRT